MFNNLKKELLTFREEQLAKHFKMGDHVKVISGMFEGETGLILRVDNNVVTLFSDLTKKEVPPADFFLKEVYLTVSIILDSSAISGHRGGCRGCKRQHTTGEL